MIIQSPYHDVEVTPVPLHEFVLTGAAGHGDRAALIDGPTGRVLTYADLAATVRRAAAGLVARGVAQGDTLALCSPNSPELAIAYFAALAAGALVTTVNPLAPADDIARQLTHSGARWLITTATLAQGSAGQAARVIDCASGLDVGPGQPGEMLIRTPGAMRGYLGNPEATAATIDAGGWLHTGDVVAADREGWFQIVDRVKELIKYKGSQVAPAALEAILLAHPAVADAAVIGRPDEEAGEIPKSPSGKILRRELAGRDQAAAPPPTPALTGRPR
jgi:acyl-CoA synthetase (AMP-forming)/AMP-acid ligase II